MDQSRHEPKVIHPLAFAVKALGLAVCSAMSSPSLLLAPVSPLLSLWLPEPELGLSGLHSKHLAHGVPSLQTYLTW